MRCAQACLSVCGHGARVLQHRRDVVLDVGRRRRQPHVALLGDRARARHFGRDARDADEFRPRSRSGCSQIPRRRCESRARRSRRPDARRRSGCRRRDHRHLRVRHRRLRAHRHRRDLHRRRRPPPPPPAKPPPPPPAPAVVKFADPPGTPDVHREAHVGVAAARRLASPSTMSARPLNLDLRDVARRRLRQQIGDDVRRIERHARGADRLHERSS